MNVALAKPEWRAVVVHALTQLRDVGLLMLPFMRTAGLTDAILLMLVVG